MLPSPGVASLFYGQSSTTLWLPLCGPYTMIISFLSLLLGTEYHPLNQPPQKAMDNNQTEAPDIAQERVLSFVVRDIQEELNMINRELQELNAWSNSSTYKLESKSHRVQKLQHS